MGQFSITAGMSNHEQISQLEWLIQNPPKDGRSVLLEMTPNLAKHILAHPSLSGANRSKRAKKIDQFSDAMKSGKWGLTGDTLKFSHKLEDGQHRLTACFRSNVPFKTHAVFGVDSAVFPRLDQGTTRSGSDVFKLAGVKYHQHASAATRWIKIFSEGKDRGTTYTPEQLLQHYESDLRNPVFDACLSEAVKAGKNSHCPIGALTARVYLAIKTGAKQNEALRFIQDMGDLDASLRSAGAICRESLKRLKSDRAGRLHEDVRNDVVDQCMRAHLNGTRITKSAITDKYK